MCDYTCMQPCVLCLPGGSGPIHQVIALLGDVPDKALMQQQLRQMEAAFCAEDSSPACGL